MWSTYFFHHYQSVEFRIYTDANIWYQYLVQLLQLVDFFVYDRVSFDCFLIDGGSWCGCRGCWCWQCRHRPGARVGGGDIRTVVTFWEMQCVWRLSWLHFCFHHTYWIRVSSTVPKPLYTAPTPFFYRTKLLAGRHRLHWDSTCLSAYLVQSWYHGMLCLCDWFNLGGMGRNVYVVVERPFMLCVQLYFCAWRTQGFHTVSKLRNSWSRFPGRPGSGTKINNMSALLAFPGFFLFIYWFTSSQPMISIFLIAISASFVPVHGRIWEQKSTTTT